VPTVDVEKREISADCVEMLKQDLWGEDNAIDRYKERIAQAEELKEYGLRRVLEDILIQEEEHKRDLLNALAK
jgi:bacterioferritin